MGTKIYRVRSGDTLTEIANHYGISLSELQGINPDITDPDKIQIGQPVKVPEVSSEQISIHLAPFIGSATPWFDIANREKKTGVSELPGTQHNPRILEYLRATSLGKAEASQDETPWCSAFVNWCMKTAGLRGTNSAWARSWLQWGVELSEARTGCIVVLDRGGGKGHVGFFVRQEDEDSIFMLGGNQHDEVNVASFSLTNLLGYRWPKEKPPIPAPGPPEAAAHDPEGLLAEYQKLFDSCEVRPEHLPEVDALVDKIVAKKDRYEKVGVPLEIPWYFIGVIHYRESSLDFDTHLHNGDPLTDRTVHVPTGRPLEGEPVFTWEFSATDAMRYKKLDKCPALNNLASMLYKLEAYNGMGYRNRGVISPYLWSYSSHYTQGKFVADHKYDPNKVDQQMGVALLLKRMAERQLAKLPGGTIALFTPAEAAVEPPEVEEQPLIEYSMTEKSDIVQNLQQFLNKWAEIEIDEDGVPGDNSSDAFLRVTGYYLPGDPRDLEPVIMYSKDEKSEAAEDLQKWLNLFPGIDIEEDGYPGKETSTAFKKVTGYYLYGDPREET